jgi:hypothetical protein
MPQNASLVEHFDAAFLKCPKQKWFDDNKTANILKVLPYSK